MIMITMLTGKDESSTMQSSVNEEKIMLVVDNLDESNEAVSTIILETGDALQVMDTVEEIYNKIEDCGGW